MPTNELMQALLRQKSGNSVSWVELISKQLEADPALVTRILYVARCLFHGPSIDQDKAEFRDLLQGHEDVREAIQQWIASERTRRRVVEAIETKQLYRLAAWKFLLKENAATLCNTCSRAMECAAENLSTPEHCYMTQTREVTPLRIIGNEVEVELNHVSKQRYRLPLYEY